MNGRASVLSSIPCVGRRSCRPGRPPPSRSSHTQWLGWSAACGAFLEFCRRFFFFFEQRNIGNGKPCVVVCCCAVLIV